MLLSDALDDNTGKSGNNQQSRGGDPVVGSSANLEEDDDSVGIDGYVYKLTRGSGGGGGNLMIPRGFLPLGR